MATNLRIFSWVIVYEITHENKKQTWTWMPSQGEKSENSIMRPYSQELFLRDEVGKRLIGDANPGRQVLHPEVT